MNELISQKTFNFFNGLTLLKYKPKVFYKNLWNTGPQLLEARGHVIDENGECVSRPFKKYSIIKKITQIFQKNKLLLLFKK